MSIKKSLLALAVAATAAMAYASPAMATDGKIRAHHAGTPEIPAGTVLHLVGWTKFTTAKGSFNCHVTWNIETTSGSTGKATTFDVPDMSKCTATGSFNGCKVNGFAAKNLPYHVTVTDNGRIDITGNIQIHSTYSNCLLKTTLRTLQEFQLTPLKTGEGVVTGTENRLGVTAALGETIAGFEIDGINPGSEVHMEDIFGGKASEAISSITGELELTSPQRCTYEITAT